MDLLLALSLLLFSIAGIGWIATETLYTGPRKYMRLRKKVVVNLTTGRSFTGILWERRSNYLVLRGAEMLEGHERVPMDGEVILEAELIEFVQVLG